MKVGIFGGAFNPIHVGHVVVAVMVKERLGLDRLILVPTYSPPHRNGDLAPFDLRFSWLSRTFEGLEGMELSDFEAKKGGKSYSIDTVRHFSRVYGTKPYFIIGEDWVSKLHTWYRYEDLMRETVFVVYPRFRKRTPKENRDELMFLEDLPLIEISASQIRERIRKGKSIRGMVPQHLEPEIIEFYGGRTR